MPANGRAGIMLTPNNPAMPQTTMSNRYLPTALGLYLNYLVHGMGVLLIALNMPSLMLQWHTNAAGISVVVASLGIGRLAALLLAGVLSDRFGRKPFVYLGMLCYLGFFIGIVSAPSVGVAFAFGLLAGIANSLLDAGTYPALMESFPQTPGTALIVVKAFVSAGQFLLPFLVGALALSNSWFGWSFIAAAAVMLLNALWLLQRPFPDRHHAVAPRHPLSARHHEAASAGQLATKGQLGDILCFTLYGYISMATFWLVSQWLAQYGMSVAGLSWDSALRLLSLYTLGSLCGVLVTALLADKRVRSATLLPWYNAVSVLALLAVCLWPGPLMVRGFALVFGFSAAGGVVQLGLGLMAQRFPDARGKATGIYYSAGSIATFTVPLVAAHLSLSGIASIMWFDLLLAGIGLVLALLISLRQRPAVRPEDEKTRLRQSEAVLACSPAAPGSEQLRKG